MKDDYILSFMDEGEILAWGNPEDGYLVYESQGQLTLEFSIAGSWAELILNLQNGKLTTYHDADAFEKQIDEKLQRDIAAKMAEYRTLLEEKGVRIFEIQKYNDFEAIQTDFGAPAKGLDFFRDLIDPTRSFRYERTRNINGTYRTFPDQAKKVGIAQSALGFQTFNNVAEDDYAENVLFFNGGVTRAFSNLIEEIVAAHDNQKEIRTPLGLDHKGAILLPIPNYGLFLWRMEEAIAGKDIDIIPIRRRDDGSVEPKSLKAVLEECRLNKTRVLAYYDCNPQNPTGHIRDKSETEEIGQMLQDYIDEARGKDLEIIRAMPQDVLISKKDAVMQYMDVMRSTLGNTIVIDDMSYEGLELRGDKKPYSFAQVSPMLAQYTAVLKGVSKVGLPGARIGMMMAHAGLIDQLAGKQLMNEFSAHAMGVDILTARYGAGPQQNLFKTHEENLRKLHTQRAGMVETFFWGINNTNRLTKKEKRKLVTDYAAFSGKSEDDARKTLEQGLPKFDLPEKMDCGFFYRLNCDSFWGLPVSTKMKDSSIITTDYIWDSNSLYWVFRGFNMHVVPAINQGCGSDMMVRITTSIPQPELFRFYDSMQTMQNYFFGKNPTVQLDLFRENVFQPV